jgi:phosphate acetyltransferase
MSFIDDIKAKAKKDKKTIVLPEYMDSRTYEAAVKIAKEEIANIVIIGTPEQIAANPESFTGQYLSRILDAAP